MAIEVICKGCARKLRVADENAGKLARCPSCGETFTVPMGPGAISTPLPSASGYSATTPPGPLLPGSGTADRWYMKTEDGTTYGPTSKAELDSWVAEGRVTARSQLLREGDTTWIAAGQLYPMLSPTPGANPFGPSSGAPAPAKNPFADQAPAAPANPYMSPGYAPPGQVFGRTGMIGGKYVQPHRGGAILTLGILGLCLCQFLGIAAVVMASQDLKLMGEGRMDSSGKGMTIAGLVLGIIGILIFVLSIIVNIAAR